MFSFCNCWSFCFLHKNKTAVHSQICRIYCSNNDIDKKKLNSDGSQFHQYQQSEQSPLSQISEQNKKRLLCIALEIQVPAWDRHKRNGVVKPIRLQKSFRLLKFWCLVVDRFTLSRLLKFWWLVDDRFTFSLFMTEHFSFYYSTYYIHIMIFLTNNISFKL